MTAYRWGAATDVGRVRSNNQDAPLAVEHLFAVADGMGGHKGGEVAARLAVRTLEDSFTEPTADTLVEAVRHANAAIFALASGDHELRGMGTTLTAIAPVEDDGDETLAVVNVGDSRTYLLRDGELQQLTEDHSLVEEMVRDGRLSPSEAVEHPQRHIVTRALGIDSDVQVDSFAVIPYTGDRYLLCSDGLFGEVDESRIAATLRRLDDPDEAARELVRLANEGGGRDNITVVVVDVVEDGGRAEAASEALRGTDNTTKVHTDLAGFTSPVDEPGETDEITRPAGGKEAKATPEAATKSTRKARRRDRPRRFTWRVAVFVLLFWAIVVAAAGAVGWQARNTFYVGFAGDEVAIFRGKPGGLLWFDPTFEEGTDVARSDVPAARMRDIERGKELGSLADARRYVENLEEQIDREGQPTTTTTSSTTTTVATSEPAPSTSAP